MLREGSNGQMDRYSDIKKAFIVINSEKSKIGFKLRTLSNERNRPDNEGMTRPDRGCLTQNHSS